MKKKTYMGMRLGPREKVPDVEVLVLEDAGDSELQMKSKKKLRHVVRHSPTGLEWGYGGSGPADLARSILIDHFEGREPLADMFYQDFKFDHVAGWGDSWEITSDVIDSWILKECAKDTDEIVEAFEKLPDDEKRWPYVEDAIRGRVSQR